MLRVFEPACILRNYRGAIMIRPVVTRLVVAVPIIGALFLQPVPAAAAPLPGISAVYDSVDAVEVSGSQITVTGIVAGDPAPTERIYTISDFSQQTGAAARCDRLALLAMTKPGKFQFATVRGQFSSFSCKLIVRTP